MYSDFLGLRGLQQDPPTLNNRTEPNTRLTISNALGVRKTWVTAHTVSIGIQAIPGTTTSGLGLYVLTRKVVLLMY